MKLRIFILFLFLPLLHVQADVIDSLMTQPRDSIGLTSDSLVLHFLEESGIPISDNNKVKLLKSGREKFIDLFEAIREAKHHVHLEYFNFRNDSIAICIEMFQTIIFELLIVEGQKAIFFFAILLDTTYTEIHYNRNNPKRIQTFHHNDIICVRPLLLRETIRKRKCGADFVYPSDGCGKTNNNDKRYDTPHLIDMGYRRTKYALPYANKK